MNDCPRCPASAAATSPRGWVFALCPDHLFEALSECRERLASTVASLERAADGVRRLSTDRAA